MRRRRLIRRPPIPAPGEDGESGPSSSRRGSVTSPRGAARRDRLGRADRCRHDLGGRSRDARGGPGGPQRCVRCLLPARRLVGGAVDGLPAPDRTPSGAVEALGLAAQLPREPGIDAPGATCLPRLPAGPGRAPDMDLGDAVPDPQGRGGAPGRITVPAEAAAIELADAPVDRARGKSVFAGVVLLGGEVLAVEGIVRTLTLVRWSDWVYVAVTGGLALLAGLGMVRYWVGSDRQRVGDAEAGPGRGGTGRPAGDAGRKPRGGSRPVGPPRGRASPGRSTRGISRPSSASACSRRSGTRTARPSRPRGPRDLRRRRDVAPRPPRLAPNRLPSRSGSITGRLRRR